MPKAKMTVKIQGEKELVNKLKAMTAAVAGEHLEAAAMAGAEVIRDEASRKAPKRTGNLAKNIEAEVSVQKGNFVEIDVGPNRDAWYGRLVEFGHAIVRGRRKAEKKIIGHVPPHPFLRPAFDEKKQEAQEAVRRELRKRILGVAE